MLKRIFIIVLLFTCSQKIVAQASWEQFGQNRVQYRTFEWSYFDSTHFRVFYYDQGKANAIHVLKQSEQELTHIAYVMGGRLDKKINIIIYNSFNDYRQTNIGRKNEEINEANGGKIDVVGDNIPVYFDGNHEHLQKQINKNIAKIIKDNMLFGENIKEIVKNSIQLNLPTWYTDGYVDYIANDFTPQMSNEVKSIIQQNPKDDITDYALQHETLIGHSFWRYIANYYGENQTANLLYLTRYRKSINSSIETIFKTKADSFYVQWKNYYYNEDSTQYIVAHNDTTRSLIATIPLHNNAEYSNFTVAPSLKEIAFVEKKDGQYKVNLYRINYKKLNTIYEGGVRNLSDMNDPNYPLLCWSPNGKKLAFLYSNKDFLIIKIHTVGQQKTETRVIKRTKIDRVTGMCYINDEMTLMLTGIKKCKSDIYKYYIGSKRVEPISNDLFDDKNPIVVKNENYDGVIIESNRTSNYIGENAKSDLFNDHFNLYLYQPATGNNLLPLSDVQKNIQQPMQWGSKNFAYLTNEDGTLKRKIINMLSRKPLVDTFSIENSSPLVENLIQQEYIHAVEKVVEITKAKKEYQVYVSSIYDRKKSDSVYNEKLKNDTLLHAQQITLQENGVHYKTIFNDTTLNTLNEIFTAKNSSIKQYRILTEITQKQKSYKYQKTFTPDFVQTSLDNTLLFTRYQPFSASNPTYSNPPLSGFLTSTLTDVLEDYKLTGGARLGADFTSLDYFFKYNNYRKRLDIEFLFFHNAKKYSAKNPVITLPDMIQKNSMNYMQTKFSYPFDIMQSIHLQTGLRYDKIETMALEKYSINVPSAKQYWWVNRAEYVYDNTISPILNIYKGTRAKFFAEYQTQINDNPTHIYNFGYDARVYKSLYKNIISASRIAGAHSGGKSKILYIVGGIDNDLNPKFDPNTVIDLSQNYAFISLATNLRGYMQGYRNGNSFVVINEEIRIPIYNTFFKRNTRSGFIRHFQVIGFCDFGSSWKGILPNEDNITSPRIVKNGNVTLYLNNNQSDFGMGYGFGFRTKLLGYFLRTDFAWNIDGIKKPIKYFSLATDF